MLKLKRRTIKVNRTQLIGDGSFANVYRISPRRVVKVFRPDEFDDEDINWFIEDEIAHSRGKGHLPVLETVDVILPGKIKPTPGLVKRFLPYEASWEDFINFPEEHWDDHEENFRKDSRGNVFIIDSQSEEAMERIW